MKLTYDFILMFQVWPESTDPQKFVYEDVAIAAYLLVIIRSKWYSHRQCLSQDLETGCLKLAVVRFLGVHILKGDHNILIFQP